MDGPRAYHTKSDREDRYHDNLYVESKIWNESAYLQNKNGLTDVMHLESITQSQEETNIIY